MATGVSIHVGLNRVDPAAYNNWDGKLSGCINDATAMKAIADGLGYTSQLMTDEQATSAAVIEALGQAAQQLASGDILLVTYSGHGGQVPDVNGDEDDGQDETWVLFDRMLIDDELSGMWKQFKEGVRIFVLSDSCHSGTVTRVAMYSQLASHPALSRDYKPNGKAPAFRAIPADVQRAAYAKAKGVYNTAQWASGKKRGVDDVEATVLLISGCLDNQLSSDGDGNGLFTANLLQVWDSGNFSGSYSAFWQKILDNMPATQSPNYLKVGKENSDFEGQKPFTIDGAASSGSSSNGGTSASGGSSTAGAGPSVSGPETCQRSDSAPGFTVTTGANAFYVFEITSDPQLFNGTEHGNDRTTDNFYATWKDDSAPLRETGPSYTLPDDAWQKLLAADRLYFRVGTTPAQDSWDGYQVSTLDDQGSQAPSFAVTD